MLLPGCSDTVWYSGLANVYLFGFVLFLDSNCGVFLVLFFLLMNNNSSKNVRLFRCIYRTALRFSTWNKCKMDYYYTSPFLTLCVIFDYTFMFPCKVARIKMCWTITCMFASHAELVLEKKCCYIFILLHHYNAVLTLI